MTYYTLLKGNTRISIRVGPESAEVSKSVDGNTSTSKEVLTPTAAMRLVGSLVKEGYTAKKSSAV